MKRFSDLEIIPKLVPIFYDEEDEYWHDVNSEWLKALAIEVGRKKKTLHLEVEALTSISVEGKEITLKELHKEPLLEFLFKNYFDQSLDIQAKPLLLRGKELNKRLFDGTYEEGLAPFIDQDCPQCNHLLQVFDAAKSRLESGQVLKCSNWDCRYKDLSEATWKPFDIELAKQRNTTGDAGENIQWIDLDHPVIPLIAKKFPSIFFTDLNLFKKVGTQEELELARQEAKYPTCTLCQSMGTHKIAAILAWSKKNKKKSIKNYENYVCSISYCSVCGSDGPSCITGNELTEHWGPVLGGFGFDI